MSQRHNPALAMQGYTNLDFGSLSVEQFFDKWQRAQNRGNSQELVNLLFWGSKIPSRNLDGIEQTINFFRFYLEIADGHSDSNNFRIENEQSGYSSFFEKGVKHSDVKQYIANKAWEQICNTLFQFENNNPYDFYWYHLFYRSRMAETIIWFFLPKYSFLRDENLNKHPRGSYEQKAYAFLKKFIAFAWQAGEDGLNPRAFSEYPNQEDYEICQTTSNLYKRKRPELIRIMAYYNLFYLIEKRKLNKPSRDTLRALAMTPKYGHTSDEEKPQNLEDAYAGTNEHNWSKSDNPEAAKILLLYPLVQSNRKQHIRKQNKVRKEYREQQRQKEREAAKKMAAAAQKKLQELG